jgi:Domain of unknown function (DUF4291)
MNLETEPYLDQLARWPTSGKHILAQFDDTSIIVYQAYCPAIARFAVKNQRFGGKFSFERMSWIKPNFLWMMYRSGWASKQDQEHILAIRIPRTCFDQLLREAIASSFRASGFALEAEWNAAIARSEVRLQWDPDHDPAGNKQERRAVQLGLRGETLEKFGHEWIVEIQDITAFVKEQAHRSHKELLLPREEVYEVYHADQVL